MVNFARFIPGTPDADYMRQQVSERGVLEKIDAVNEVIKRGLGEEYSVTEVTDFYKMIADIENSLKQNMNDPRAKNLANSFADAPKAEAPKATVKMDAPKNTDEGTKEPEVAGDADGDQGTVVDEGTKEPEVAGDADGDQGTVVDEGTKEPEVAGDAEAEQPTRRGRKKSGDAE